MNRFMREYALGSGAAACSPGRTGRKTLEPANLTQAAEETGFALETAYYAGYDDSPKHRFPEGIYSRNHGHCSGMFEGVLCDSHMNALPNLTRKHPALKCVTKWPVLTGTHAYNSILVWEYV